MKLYYSPGACSLSPHIVLEEGGFNYSIEKVNLRSKETETGENFTLINPKGYVPALELDDGTILTEGPAIIQYLADQKPQAHLAPPNQTIERYQLMSMLNFISTEIHKNFSPLFNAEASEPHKQMAIQNLKKRFDLLAQWFNKQDYIMGNEFTVADAYLFTVLSWTKPLKIDLSPWPKLTAYLQKMSERPSVQKALKAEHLI